MAGPRDGSRTAREGRTARARLACMPTGRATASFMKLTERTAELFVDCDDTQTEDVRRTLLQVRAQYDSVHNEAEMKEAKLRSLREAINSADQMHNQKAEETTYLDDKRRALVEQLQETDKRIKDTQTSRKVYEHMLARIQKEQAILKQKMLMMEEHLARKRNDVHRKVAQGDKAQSERLQQQRALEAFEEDATAEREACTNARSVMRGEMERRREGNKQKAKFEGWRHEVALDAANEAFNASAGRLRKLYAIEKLCGNSLQKITFEQVERSQNTEDGFQKIREVTGLTDVMDIVHKFLNRDVEHDQLKGSVKDAEVRLEALRQDLELFKQQTEGITFDRPSDASGGIFKEIEATEQAVSEAMQEHEASRVRLQKMTLQSEHMKRWATRVGQLLSSLEDPVKVEGIEHLAPFFRRLDIAVERFTERVSHQIADGKLSRKALMQVINKEYNQQTRTLSDQEFLRNNCRVPAAADAPGRASSRQGASEDDPAALFADDRERCRRESEDVARVAQQEQQKRSRPKG